MEPLAQDESRAIIDNRTARRGKALTVMAPGDEGTDEGAVRVAVPTPLVMVMVFELTVPSSEGTVRVADPLKSAAVDLSGGPR